MKLDSGEIGKRLATLRKAKGLTQEEVASQLGLNRTAITQIENGNRDITALELRRLADILGFSIDELVADEFRCEEATLPESGSRGEEPEERISVPELNVEKFKNVLLYILGKCAGKPNVGETALYKLLYFCDFNYYELYEEHLTGASYRKLNFGPVPRKAEAIIKEMVEERQIQKIKTEYHGYRQTRYIPLVKPDLSAFSAAEKEVIDNVLDRMADWSAKMLTEYSHNDKPWKATDMNATIDYELAFYREPPYSVRAYEEDEQDNL